MKTKRRDRAWLRLRIFRVEGRGARNGQVYVKPEVASYRRELDFVHRLSFSVRFKYDFLLSWNV